MVGKTFDDERWWSGVLFPDRHMVVCREASIPQASEGGKLTVEPNVLALYPGYSVHSTVDLRTNLAESPCLP